MSSEHDDTASLEQLLTECYDELHAGRQPDLDRICREHPALQSRLETALRWELEFSDSVRRERLDGAAVEGLARDEVVGDFRVVDYLSSGGMGDVYVAMQESLGRSVALKVVARRGQLDKSAVVRFRREAEITASLDHPNIVPIYATGVSNGVVYLAMKLLDGQSLDRLGQIEPRRAARYGQAIARALDAAHRIGVVHRDVKPGNIVIEGDTPYMLDFGLARSDAFATVTQENAAPGTLPYMAPELLRGRTRALDPRVDVYGLGATLYEAVGGRPPFDPDPPASAVRRILTEDPPRLRGVDRDLAVIIDRAMDKDPRRRFQTAAELADELERYLRGESIVSRPSGVLRKTWKLARRNPTASLAISLVALGSLVVAGLIAERQWAREQRWQQENEWLRSDVDAGDFARARTRVAELRKAFADRPELEPLAREVQATESLELLLGELGARTSDRVTRKLYDGVQGVLDVPKLAKTPSARFALAFTAELAERHDEARAWLDDLARDRSFPRATAALRAVVEAGNLEEALASNAVDRNASPRDRAQDHVFAEAVLALAGRSLAEREGEIVAAEDIDPGNPRARYALGMIRERQEEGREAYEIFRGLEEARSHRGRLSAILANIALSIGMVRTPGVADPAVRRARIDRWIGRARKHIERAKRDADVESPNSNLLLAELRLLSITGPFERFWQEWKAGDRLADSASYWRVAETAAIAEGRFAASRQFLQRAMELTVSPSERLLQRARMVALDLELQMRGELDPEALREIARESAALAADARELGEREPELRALAAEGTAWVFLGERLASFHAVHRACRIREDANNTMLYAWHVAARINAEYTGSEDAYASLPPVERYLELAWVRLHAALDQGLTQEGNWFRAHWTRFWLAWARDDVAALVDSAAIALHMPQVEPGETELFRWCIDHGLPPFERVLPPGEVDRPARDRARRILQDSLAAHVRRTEAGEMDTAALRNMTNGWLESGTFARVRETRELAAFEAEERAEWESLWAEVRRSAGR